MGPGAPDVLVLRALGIGDLCTAVPALRGIRRGWPGHRVVLAAPGWLRPLVDTLDAVDVLLATPELGPPPYAGPPQVAVNLHGRGPQSTGLLRDLGPDLLVAFAHPELPQVTGPRWWPGEPEVARWCRLVASTGRPADPADRTLPPPAYPAPAPGAVVVHPGAKDPDRRWPAERFAAVAAALADAGAQVVVTGSPAEAPLAAAVAAAAGLPADHVLAGATCVGELAAQVAAARLLVSGDTGAAHLAAAYGTASVTVFGTQSPAVWGPPPGNPRHVALWAGADRPPAEALSAVPVAEVLDAATGLLAGYPGSVSPPTGASTSPV
ncbi:MAG: glycosyltransferase family 9 protein [Actinomycetota bacterium]